MNDVIYLDNAATALHKPTCVAQAVYNAFGALASPGRGAYEPALLAARTVQSARQRLAMLIHAESSDCIAFTLNATMALNTALQGLLHAGDHVITTVCEHNSVLRPLYRLAENGVHVTHLGCDEYARLNYAELEGALTPQTKAVVVAHASNVTGNVVDLAQISAFTHKHGLLLIVDAAQTLGCYPLDVQASGIDVLCFTGHKSLLGPQGTGGIYVRQGLQVAPLVVGGSGVQSFSKTQPCQMPTALEAGTLNVQGIAGLNAALGYLLERGVENIHAYESKLAQSFARQLKALPAIKLYGDYRTGSKRIGIVSLNVADEDAGVVSDWLYENYHICTRAGAHCAPLMHEALGTQKQGVVRFSFSCFNTLGEVDIAAKAVAEFARG